MTSQRYVKIHKGRINMRKMHIGGAVPILLNTVEKAPEVGGEIGSNQIVGVITPPAPVLEGGRLLKNIHFGHAPKKENDRIKFIF